MKICIYQVNLKRFYCFIPDFICLCNILSFYLWWKFTKIHFRIFTHILTIQIFHFIFIINDMVTSQVHIDTIIVIRITASILLEMFSMFILSDKLCFIVNLFFFSHYHTTYLGLPIITMLSCECTCLYTTPIRELATSTSIPSPT